MDSFKVSTVIVFMIIQARHQRALQAVICKHPNPPCYVLTDGRPLSCALLSPSGHEGGGMDGRGDRPGETQSGPGGPGGPRGPAGPPSPPEDRYPEWRRLGLMTRLVATGLVVRGASAVAKLLRGR